MAACRDIFHLLAVEEEGGGWAGRFGATHPPLERRIERLERMERALQSARWPRRGAARGVASGESRRGGLRIRIMRRGRGRSPVRLGADVPGLQARQRVDRLPARVPAGRRPQLEVQVAGGGVAGAPTKPIGWPVTTASPFFTSAGSRRCM